MHDTQIYTEAEVSDLLQISRSALRKWRQLRTGPPYIRTGRNVRYRADDLEAWLRTRQVNAREA